MGLRALLVAAIRDRAHHADRLGLLIAMDLPPHHDPSPFVIRADDLTFEIESARAKCFLKAMTNVVAILRCDVLQERLVAPFRKQGFISEDMVVFQGTPRDIVAQIEVPGTHVA